MTGTALETVFSNKGLVNRFSRARADKDMKWMNERRYAIQAIQKSPQLMQAVKNYPEDVEPAMLMIADVGLSLNPVLGQSYLVPFWDWKAKSSRIQVIIGYRGMVYGAQKADTIQDCMAEVVYATDSEFQVRLEDGRKRIIHTRGRAPKHGEITHAYDCANYTGGGGHAEEMTITQLLKVRDWIADSRKDKQGNPRIPPIWKADFPFLEETYKKTVIRRSWKYWPLDRAGNLQRIQEAVDRAEPLKIVEADPGEPELCLSSDQVRALHALITDHEFSGEEADHWLKRYAEKYGRTNPEDLAADLFEPLQEQIKERIEKAKQKELI